MLFLVPVATPVFATNTNALTLTATTATFVHTSGAPSSSLGVKVANPATNQYPISSITLIAASGWKFNGTAPANCGTIFGGVWTTNYGTSTGAVTCTSPNSANNIPVGYTSAAINFGPLDAPSAATGSAAVSATFTDSVTDTSGSGAYQSGTLSLQGIASVSKIDLSPYVNMGNPATFIAGSSAISYTLTLGSAQSGVSVSLAASGSNSGTLSASSVTTGTGGTASFSYTPSNTADTSQAACALSACSDITATLLGTSNSTFTYTVPSAPSKVTLKLSGLAFPTQYNVTTYFSPGPNSGNWADFSTSSVTYKLADAFGNAIGASQVTITSATLSGGSFWGNSNSTTQVTHSGSIAVTGGLTNVGPAGSDYDQSGAFGTTGTFTMTIVGTYNGAGFSASGTSGKLYTSLFDSSANVVKVYGSTKVGSTVTVTYKLSVAQSGVSVKITAQETANVSAGFTDSSWVGGATAYAHTTGALASVTVTTGSTGKASATFTLATQALNSVSFVPSIKYSIDGPAPSTTSITHSGGNQSITAVARSATNFGVQVLWDGDAGSVASSVIVPNTLYLVAYITDSYGNLVTNPGTQLQVQLTVSSGALGASSPFIASGDALTNDTHSFGLDAWVIPLSATGTLTVTASGLYTTGTATVAVVSANPSLTIKTTNGITYTSGSTIYTSSSSVAVSGKATVSAGYEASTDKITNVYAALNAAASASYKSFATGSFASPYTWNYVNPTALTVGTNTVNFKAGDGTANSTVSTLSVVYDPNAPTITFPTTLTLNSGQSLGVTITTGANDLNTTSIAVSVNGTATTNFTFSSGTLTISGLSAGHKSVAVTAATLAKLSATVTKVVTVNVASGSTFTSSAGATAATSGGFKGAQITFTNNAAASETVNVYFVWYNSANQVVSVGAQLNVVFSAGQSQTFFGSYQTSGTYTVKVFIQDATGNGLSSSYSVTVTI